MKKLIILSLIAIVLTAYGGLKIKVVKEKYSISYSIQADQAITGASHIMLPQARAREVSIQELRLNAYGPEIFLAKRFNWQHRSDRLRLNELGLTAYKPIAKPYCTLAVMSPPKICWPEPVNQQPQKPVDDRLLFFWSYLEDTRWIRVCLLRGKALDVLDTSDKSRLR